MMSDMLVVSNNGFWLYSAYNSAGQNYISIKV